jgi:membrane-bound lytic murein transglycosylase A
MPRQGFADRLRPCWRWRPVRPRRWGRRSRRLRPAAGRRSRRRHAPSAADGRLVVQAWPAGRRRTISAPWTPSARAAAWPRTRRWPRSAARRAPNAQATTTTPAASSKANFRPEAGPGQGLLTAYFAPEYEARMSRSAEFSAPMRGKPADLVNLDLAPVRPGLGRQEGRRRDRGRPGRCPIPTARPSRPRRTDPPLAWMRPEDLFFLQIQGSGILVLPDGRRVRAAFAGPQRPAVRRHRHAMRDRGLLPDNNTSGDAIRTWLADHRGPEADAIMQLNPRYVFFRPCPTTASRRWARPASRCRPAGPSPSIPASTPWASSSGWTPARRSWPGAFPTYRRLAVALDVGGAIKGDVRADLYTGTGPAAGAEAGRVRHDLRLYRLVPRG